MTRNVPTIEVGIERRMLNVEDQEPRNSQHTTAVHRTDSTSVNSISPIASSTYRVPSNRTERSMPGGRVSRIVARAAFTDCATVTALAPRCLRMPIPTDGTPSARAIRRRSVSPSSTMATSSSRTGAPLRHATTRARNSATVGASPVVRTFISRRPVSIRPAGTSTCSRGSAASTSATARPRASIASSFSQIRSARCASPESVTSPTPGSVWNRSFTRSRATSMRVPSGTWPESATQRMGLSSGLFLEMTGGRLRAADASLACTSCTAASMSRSSPNSIVTDALPWRHEAVTSRIPSTLITTSSTVSTTSVSMISGDAPSSARLTLTVGKSTSGSSETPSREKPTAPKTTRKAISIQANTGCLIATSGIDT